MTTIVITGGHHNSALVVAQDLQKKGIKVIWIGHRYASRGDQNDSAEYSEVTSQKIPFHDLRAGRLTLSLGELMRLPLGIIHACKILREASPDAILTFGGYLGGTVAIAGAMQGIRFYLHEQTVTAGKANKLITGLARKIYLTWPTSQRQFPQAKSEVVGLPLRPSILKAKPKKIFVRNKPTLLIMGGKQGSHPINLFIFRHLKELLTHYNIIHQTGTNSQTQDYEAAIHMHTTLGSFRDSYLPLGYIGQDEIGSYLAGADYYLGRSGAHITYELAVLGIPSILIPYIHTHDNEQYQNALYLESLGTGSIVLQNRLNLRVIMTLLKHQKQKKVVRAQVPRNASATLINDLLGDLRGN